MGEVLVLRLNTLGIEPATVNMPRCEVGDERCHGVARHSKG